MEASIDKKLSMYVHKDFVKSKKKALLKRKDKF